MRTAEKGLRRILADAILVDREDTIILFDGRYLVNVKHDHQLLQSLVQTRQSHDLAPMLNKQHRRLTHTMVYARIEYLDIAAGLAGYAIVLVSWLWILILQFQPLVQYGELNLLISRVVVRTKILYSKLEWKQNVPLNVILPWPRFNEIFPGIGIKTSIYVTPITPNLVFGISNYERVPIQSIRCFTADFLVDKYGIILQSGEVYRPAQNWWLLVSVPQTHFLFQPLSLV